MPEKISRTESGGQMSEYFITYRSKPKPFSGEKIYHGKMVVVDANNEEEAVKRARKLLRRRFTDVIIEGAYETKKEDK